MAKSRKSRTYKRDKAGKFSRTNGSGVRSVKADKARNKRRGSGNRKRSVGENRIAKRLALRNRKTGGGPRKKANISQKAIRRERNKEALSRLRARGAKIPKGSLNKVAQLKKGQSIKLSNGVVIKRSKDGKYTATKIAKKKK